MRYGLLVQDAECIVGPRKTFVSYRAVYWQRADVSVTVREIWQRDDHPDVRLPYEHGCSFVFAQWHAEIPGVGQHRICLDSEREGDGHPLMHTHLPGAPKNRLAIHHMGVPHQWLKTVEALIP